MRPEWERGLRGRIYALGRRLVPLSWRRAIRRRFAPERFLGIRKPPVDVPRYDFDASGARPGRPDVVVLPVIAWSYRRQRPQQLSEALARRGRRVFYGSLAGEGEPAEATGVAPGVTLLPLEGVRREDPGDRALGGDPLDAALRALSRARDEFGIHEAALIVQSPFWEPLAGELRTAFRWKVVYDCLDDYGSFSANRAAVLLPAEQRLIASADLVIATSEPLLEKIRRTGPEARLLPNAADVRTFAALPDPDPRPGRVTVGYAGAVDEWFDAELVASAARLRPDWRFEIVGAIGARGPASSRFPENVVLLGERRFSELSSIRGGFDVEMIPFRLTPLTHATDPVKLYEALAAGRGVVATPMRALDRFAAEGLVRRAATAEELVAAVEATLAADAVERPVRRAFAAGNTWETRAAALSTWLEELWPLVSILVVTHDGMAWTRMCLDSLDRSTDWPRYEIVFADNASTDGTREWLREEASRRGEAFRVVELPENRGFAAGVNAAARSARGTFLCLLNNDTVLTRGWLSALVRHLQDDASLGMVGPATNEIANEARVEVGYRELDQLDEWSRRFTRENAGRLEDVPMLAMFCALLSRATWERIGPLDERFAVGMFEDDDYARRLAEHGLRLAVARDSFVHHAGRGTFRALPHEEYVRVFEANRRRFEEKWGAAVGTSVRAPADWDEVRRTAESAGAVFVFPPTIGWDVTLVQRPHHLARAFGRLGFPVVFEEEGTGGRGAALVRVAHNVWSSPPSRASSLLPNRVTWAFAYNVPERDDGARLVYDVIDHLDVFPYPAAGLRRSHERALADAEAVFAVSRPLLDEVRARRADACYLPNGVEFERFAAPPEPALVPEGLARERGRPRAGYVGALARWVDADLLHALARLRSDWDFVVVGEELDESFSGLVAAPPSNIVFLGARPYASIPAILSRLDAGLIPFAPGPEAIHASPIKLYEYLAAGLPVISTPIPEAEEVPEVGVAANAEGFSALLDRARGSRRSDEFRRRARERARANDWMERARTALAKLGLASGASPRVPAAG